MSFQTLSRVILLSLFVARLAAGSGALGGCNPGKAPCLSHEIDGWNTGCLHPKHLHRNVNGKPWCVCPTDGGSP